jgi:hypothetical protein
VSRTVRALVDAFALVIALVPACRTPPDEGILFGDGAAPDLAVADLARTGNGAIGDPCASGADCQTGLCETNGFPNGYCTEQVAECPAPGATQTVCPPGSLCQNWPVGNTDPDLCLKDCSSNLACRLAEGYVCCMLNPQAHWCVPADRCLPK